MDNPLEESPQSFSEFDLSPELLSNLSEVGYERPTEPQAAAIPPILAGSNVIVRAQTGTGKTAAYVIPVLEKLAAGDGAVQVLTLTPTRELARQVCSEFERLGQGTGIEAFPIYGGVGFEPQFDAAQSAQVIAATPGRLLDLVDRNRISFKHLKVFILDEADEMLSMGFEKEVSAIISNLPAKRQSLLLSATVDAQVQRFADSFLEDPVFLDLSTDSVGALSVEHRAYSVNGGEKPRALLRILDMSGAGGALIFVNTKAGCFRVAAALEREGLNVGVINSDLSQNEREKALRRMREDRISFLVATDVAARGIDISGLPAVVNYDMPAYAEAYVHRTGRTGRAGQFGVAYSLVLPSDVTVCHQLGKFYDIELWPQPLPTGEEARRAKADRLLDQALAGLDEGATLDYATRIPLARRLKEHPEGTRIIAKLLADYGQRSDGKPVIEAAASADATEPVRPAKTREPKRAERDAPKQAKAEEADGESRPKRKRSRSRTSESKPTSTDTTPDTARDSGPKGQRAEKPSSEKRARAQDPADSPAISLDLDLGPASFSDVRLSLGDDDIKDEDALLADLVELAGLEPEDLDGIDVKKRHSVVKVRSDYVDDFIAALDNQSLRGTTLRVSQPRGKRR